MGHPFDDECVECLIEKRLAETGSDVRSEWWAAVKDPEYRKNAPKIVYSSRHMSFTAILDEIEELHDKKQQDYGRVNDPYANVRASEDFGIPGWVGTIVRANDKMRRLQKFAQDQALVNESVEDSLLDLATYAIIALDLYRRDNNSEWKEAWRE